MPLYEFHCDKCDSQFDRFVKISEKESVLSEPCKNCGEVGGVTSVLSAPPLCDPFRLGVTKSPSHVRDKLADIQKNTYKANMKGGNGF